MAHGVQPNARHAFDLSINPHVVVAEEAELGLNRGEGFVQPLGLARVSTLVATRHALNELDSTRGIVEEHHLERAERAQLLELVVHVVTASTPV